MIRWNSYNSDTRTQTNSITKDTRIAFFLFYKKEILFRKRRNRHLQSRNTDQIVHNVTRQNFLSMFDTRMASL